MNQKSKCQGKRRASPKLPAAARWTLRGLVLLPLLALTIASAAYFVALFHLLRANLVPIAETELTRQTGHQVKIGGADFSKRGALVLTDIAISNKATFAAGHGEATLRAKRLTVDYNLHSLIFDSGNAAHAVGDITLDSPQLLVERFPGGYNFSDFFKPKTTKVSKPFVGRVLIHHGLLRFRDFQAPANVGARPALNTLSNVEGTIDLGSERNVYFDVRGNGTGQRFAALAVSGDVSRQGTGRYRGHVVAANADAAYWTAYFKAFPQAHVAAGRADVDVTLAKLATKPSPGLPLDLSGHVLLRQATIAVTDRKLVRLPLRNLTGTVAFTMAGLSLDAHVTVAGQPLAVAGTVFDYAGPSAHPQIAMTAQSPRLDPARLADALPILKVALPSGVRVLPGPVTANFTGTPGNPTITVSARLPAVVYLGNQATNLAVQATYADKVLSVPTATFRLNGTGQAALRATVDTTRAKPVILIAGTARGVNLANLRLPPGINAKSLRLGGLADTQFLADNQGRPFSVVANVSVANPHLRQTTLRSLVGRVAWTQGQALTITRAIARDPAGAAAFSGQVPAGGKEGRWDLTVRTTGLDIASLLQPYSHLALGGRASFDGKILGASNAPQAVGMARLVEPHFGRYAADLVSGQVTASLSGVRLTDVTLRRFPTEARVNGTMIGPMTALATSNPALDFRVQLSQGDVSDFLSLAEQSSAPSPKTAKALTAALPNLTGTAEGDFRLTGRLKSPIASGHAVVTDATVGEYRLDRVAADLRYENGALQVDNGLVRSGAATLTAHGRRTAAGVIGADFAATGLSLLQFHRLFDPYADVSGTVSFTGHFGGTPQAPHVALTALDVPDLVVNRQQFAPFTLAGRYDDGVLTQTGAPWRFSVALPNEYLSDADQSVVYQINSLRLALPTAAHPSRPGELSLKAAIPTATPDRISHVLATLRGTLWARTPAGQKFLAQLESRLPQPLAGTFALPQVEVTGPLTALAVKADLSASELVLGETRIGSLTAGLNYQAGGQPTGHVIAQASGLLAAGVPISTLTADADYRNRVVAVHQFRATSERAFLNASGTANLDGDVAANVDASNIPLAGLATILPATVPYFNPAVDLHDPNLDSQRKVDILKSQRQAMLDKLLAALPREISALSMTASGPTKTPNLVGSVSLSNPEGVTAGGTETPTYALDRIRTGAITLASASPGGPRLLTVNDLAAFKNGRLVATLAGTLPVPFGDLMKPDTAGQLPGDQDDLHADLQVQDLSALALFSPGLVDPKKTGGQLKASANFGGGRLSGLVTVTDASLGLTSFDTTANKINGVIVLADNKANIQSFGGQSSKGGTFALTGSAALASDADKNMDVTMDMRLAAKDLIVDENSKQNVLYQKYNSGLQAKINGAITAVGPWQTPTIATPSAAPLVVSDAKGILPVSAGSGAKASGPSSFDPIFRVAVQLGGGRSKTVSVRYPLLRADGTGLVTLDGHLSNPTLHARLNVVSGQFSLPPSTLLKVVKPITGEENTVDLVYSAATGEGDLPGVQTWVNLTTQATVSPSPAALAQYRSAVGNGVGEAAPQDQTQLSSTAFGGQRQRYVITAYIHGLLNSKDLKIDLSSSPGGLTQTQLMAALVPAGALVAAASQGAGGQNVLEQQLQTAISSVLIPSLLSPLTQSLAQGIGLNSLDVSYEPDLPVFVTLTKDIAPGLQATYSRSFGARTPGAVNATLSPPQYTLKLGYRLNNRLQLGVSTDDQRNNTLSLEGVFGF